MLLLLCVVVQVMQIYGAVAIYNGCDVQQGVRKLSFFLVLILLMLNKKVIL